MSKVIIGISNANLESDLRSLLDEMQGVEVVAVAHDTGRLAEYVGRFEPELILLHEGLGPEPSQSIIRDLTERHPAAAIVQISPERSSQTVIRALEAGARGVVAYPFAFEDFAARINEAFDWAARMQRILAGAAAALQTGRGRVVTVVGAKGGVGVTTIAVHLALDHLNRNPSDKVCVVDLDLEKGDVSALIDVRHSVSVADLAKVHQDLSAGTVSDAVTQHESGIHLMLAPVDVRQSEFVTTESLRAILSLLRREFDLVIIDGGGYVSPTQAAAIELGNETLVVTTPDVLSVRALRKRILAWEALGVRNEGELRILLNKVDRSAVFPAEAVAKLTTGQVLATHLPMATRILEPGVNERDPQAVTDVTWWRLISKVRAELGMEEKPQARRRSSSTEPPSEEPATRRRRLLRRNQAAESGAIALENVAVIPMALGFIVMLWQLAVLGLGALWLGQASTEATRTYAITGSVYEATQSARKTIPEPFSSGVHVSASGNSVWVTVKVPPGSFFLSEVTSHHTVTKEP